MTSHLRAFAHATTITAAALSTLALGATTNTATAATAAAGDCTATIAVTDDTGASLGSMAPGGFSTSWMVPGSSDPLVFTVTDTDTDGLLELADGNGLSYAITYEEGGEPDNPNYYNLVTGDASAGQESPLSVGRSGLLSMSVANSNGDRVAVPTAVSKFNGDFRWSGGITNIDQMRQNFPSEQFFLTDWTLTPTAGSDCSAFGIGAAPDNPTVEPTVTVDGGPADGATVTEAPTYTFYANTNAGVTGKECRIDAGDWAACDSPYTVPIDGLADGIHTVDFRAVTPSSYSTVVSRTFVLDVVMDPAPDTTAPVVTFASGTVDGTSYDTAPTFTFSSTDTDVAGYECSIDGAAFRSCTSPITPDTAPGTHTLAVRATDTAGNTSSPVSTTWILRDVVCDDARAELREARAERRDVKTRLAIALASGKEYRIKKVRAQLRDARAEVRSAKANVAENC